MHHRQQNATHMDAINSLILEIDPKKLDEQTQRDLEANAQLQRITQPELLALLLTKRLGGIGTVRPYINANAA